MKPARTTSAGRRALWALVPALAALVVHANTLRGGFVYDDETLIQKNPAVQDLEFLPRLAVTPLFASLGAGSNNYYRPVPMAAYNLLWHAGGGKPLPFHILNLLVHMLNAVLVMQLVRRIAGSSDLTALGAATIFAVHPLGTEAVAWASSLPELSYAALSLSALSLHVVSWNRAEGLARRFRTAACALFVLACLCKETALTVVPLVVLLELWVRPARAARSEATWRAAGWSVAPYLGAAALYLAARFAVLGGLVPPGFDGTRTVGDAALSAGWLILGYLRLAIAPWTLLVDRLDAPVTSALDPRFLVPAALLAAGSVAVARIARQRPDMAFAAALAVVPLIPALYIPALGRNLLAERYAYLPIAGVSWLAVGAAQALARAARAKAPDRIVAALVIAIAVAGGSRTLARNADWRDNERLGAATMRDEPRAAVGYLLLGQWNVEHGKKDDALRTFETGLARVPSSINLRLNATALGSELGRVPADAAIAAYRDLASSAPANPSVHYNLGQVLLKSRRFEEAKASFERTLQLTPTSVLALTALAVIASEQGDADGCIRLCRRALAIDRRSTQARQQLGVALLRSGDTNGAIAELEQAVAIDPNDKESLSRLGVAYATAGRTDDARRSWERALAIDPGFSKARQNLERLRRGGR